MSPSPEIWKSIETHSKEFPDILNSWNASELPDDRLLCLITTPTGIELQALMATDQNGVAYISLPTPTFSGLRRERNTVAEVIARNNGRQLKLKKDDLEGLHSDDVAKSFGLELKKGYQGEWCRGGVYPHGEEGTLGIMFYIDPTQDRKGDYITNTQLAIGVAKDFEDAFPGWKLKPQDKIRI
jgi:hypothetical protein